MVLAFSSVFSLIRLLRVKFRPLPIHGMTIGEGRSPRVFLSPDLPPQTFSKTVRHELVHLAKEQGMIVRDLATLFEVILQKPPFEHCDLTAQTGKFPIFVAKEIKLALLGGVLPHGKRRP
jgi:hypothetical protein